VAGGRSVSLALFADVSNSRYALSPLTIASATVRAARPGSLCLAHDFWRMRAQGAPGADAVGDAGAGGRLHQRVAGNPTPHSPLR
jgi:hypothetical protein